MGHFELGGNPQLLINAGAAACLLGIAGITALGWLADRAKVKGCQAAGASISLSWWSIALLVASYALLVPGLQSVLFSFNVMIDFTLIQLGVGPGGGVDKVPPTTESMLGLVHLLQTTDCPLGAAAVILYAMVVPGVKVLLLVLAQLLRSRFSTAAFVCVHVVQGISKWACPDMFAYILLTYLVRGLNHPVMLQADMTLDLGFTCFSIFCVGSTVASLGISFGQEASSADPCRRRRPLLRPGLALALSVVLACAFAVAFVTGMVSNVMALRIRLDDLFAPKGPLPAQLMGIPLEPVIDNLHIPEKANADVSILQALGTLHTWASQGEVNSWIAFVMLAVFVVALTVADVVVLVASAALLFLGRRPGPLLPAAAVLRKLSMLDVLVMGVVVVTMCMAMYQKDGIFVSMCSGVLWLLAAELLHYATYYVVMSACEEDAAAGALGEVLRQGTPSSGWGSVEDLERSSQEEAVTPMLGPL